MYIGTFSVEANFWVAHPLKKSSLHKASVVNVRFDNMSGRAVFSCSLDGTVQVSSCYQAAVDGTDAGAGPFGTITSFGENLLSISSNGWINGLSVSPDCSQMCYVTQDCEVNFVDLSGIGKDKKPETIKVLHKGNPHLQCIYVDESTVITTGFDKVPYVYKKSGASWAMTKVLDENIKNTRQLKISGNSFKDRRVYFNADIKLSAAVELKETDTLHHNYINCLRVFG